MSQISAAEHEQRLSFRNRLIQHAGVPIAGTRHDAIELLDPAAIELFQVGQRVFIRSTRGRLRADSLTVGKVDRDKAAVYFYLGHADLAAVDPGDLVCFGMPPGGHTEDMRPTPLPPEPPTHPAVQAILDEATSAPAESGEAWCERVKAVGDISPPGSRSARLAAAVRLEESELLDEDAGERLLSRLADRAGVDGQVYSLADGRCVHLAVVPEATEEDRRAFVEGVTAHMR